jgi:hypothetical protein
MSVRTYDLKQNRVLVNGQEISGFGADGALEYENASDLMERTKSADGVNTTFSVLNDEDLFVEITVLETSYAYKVLSDELKAMKQALKDGNPIPKISYYHRDRINGDTISSDSAVFMARPTASKGRTTGERVFRICLPNAAEQALFGDEIDPV